MIGQYSIIMRMALPALLILLACSGDWLAAQAPAPAPPATAAAPAPTPSPTLRADDLDATMTLDMNNVPVDQLIKLFSDSFGKPVFKHKNVNTQVTIKSPKPVTKRRALEMITDALAIENVLLVEQEDQLQIIPADQLANIQKLKKIGPAEDLQTYPDSMTVARWNYQPKYIALEALRDQLKPYVPEGVMSIDPPAKTITLTDRVSRLKYYDKLVKLYDSANSKDRVVETFTLKHLSPKAAATSVSWALNQMPASAEPGGKVEVIAEETQGWLVVSCPKSRLPEIKALIERLDQAGMVDVQPRTIELTHANFTMVFETLKNVLPDNETRAEPDKIKLMPTENKQRLVVISSEKNFNMIRQLVVEIDQEPDGVLEPHPIDLQNIDVDTAIRMLQQVLADKEDRSGKDRIRFVPSASGKRLIVICSGRQFEKVQKLVSEFDQEQDQDMHARTIELQHIDMASMVDAVNKLFPNNNFKPEKEQIKLVPSEDGKRLIVHSSEKNFKLIKNLTTEYDREQMSDVQARLIPINHIEVSSISNAISQLYQDRGFSAEKEKIRVVATDDGNRLIVLSSEKNYHLVKSLVEEMDTEQAEKKETRSYPVKNLEVQDLADQLTKLFEERESNNNYYDWWGGWGGGGRRNQTVKPSFVPSPRTNTLMVLARPRDFGFIEKMIKELDVEFAVSRFDPHIYPIRHTDANELVKVLESLFRDHSQSTNNEQPWYYYSRMRQDDKKGSFESLFGDVRFVVDNVTNRIVALASNPRDYEIIDRMVQQLDQLDPESTDVLVYDLKYANAIDVANRLNNLFSDGAVQQQGATELDPTFRSSNNGRNTSNNSSSNNNSNSNNNSRTTARSVVMPWQSGGARREEGTRPINTMIGNIRVVPDTRSNKLMIAAPRIYYDSLNKMLQGLDTQEPQVYITARIVEVVQGRDKRIGIRWTPDPSSIDPAELDTALLALGQLGIIEAFGGGNRDNVVSSEYENDRGRNRLISTKPGRGNTILGADVNIALLLQLLVKNSSSKVLSEPSISVNNNETGNIFFGSEFPFLNQSLTTDVGSVTQGINYQPVGINLDIMPHINSRDEVVLRAELENSNIRDGEFVNGQIIKDVRRFSTELAVESGQTMVIGGILLEDNSRIERGVPVLSRIPIIKYAFSKSDRTSTIRELVFFITPEVLAGREDDERILKQSMDQLKEIERSSEGGPQVQVPEPQPLEPEEATADQTVIIDGASE